MKKRIALIYLFLTTFQVTFAEEGMLIPSIIAAFESDMKAKGMKLTAEQIYSVNHASLKDAIIHFGGGCTAEIVSKSALLLTNHHCGYSQVQSHSSLENDYLKNGFWAKNQSEELKNPGLTASRMVRIDDVTQAVLFGTQGITDEKELTAKMRQNVTQLIKDATTGTHYEAEIKAFNQGNEYYIIVKEVFLDVRLVGTPPNSIGKFGGDTDNWVWPRHTGDFSVFRIYAGSDNKPAAYSPDNKPYEPLHYLPISFKNRSAGDFTMVYGFPGETEQHVVSNYLKFIMEKERPARILMRDKSLSVIDAGMRSSDEIRIKYAAKQASIANAWKKWIGQIDGLRRMDAISVKQKSEKEFNERAQTKEAWKKEYGNLTTDMNALVSESIESEFRYSMGVEYLFVGPEYFKLARAFSDFVNGYDKLEAENGVEAAKEKLIASAEGFFKNWDAGVDQKIFELLTEEYYKQIDAPKMSKMSIGGAKYAELIYTKSAFTNKDRYIQLVKNYKPKSAKKLKKDVGFTHWETIFDDFIDKGVANYRVFDGKMDALLKAYVKGKLEMFPDQKHWADANSTLRITYGQLEGSTPADGLQYMEHTSIDGIIAKYYTGNPDFEILPRMFELYEKKDYGDYAQNGELWVCFTGSNHTTGGNSGSPVIDANGNLMGLNFDRSWESTMSDFMFDPNRCRNIVVDIRYVLWVMDKYSGAKHLVDEMTLVRE